MPSASLLPSLFFFLALQSLSLLFQRIHRDGPMVTVPVQLIENPLKMEPTSYD